MVVAQSIRDGSSLTAIEVLFTEHVDSVFNVGYRMTWSRADAQDVTQNTFLKALTHLDQLDDPSKARAWLVAIAYREGLMMLRRQRELPTDPADLAALGGRDRDPVDVVLRGELASMINAAIDRLNDCVANRFCAPGRRGIATCGSRQNPRHRRLCLEDADRTSARAASPRTERTDLTWTALN
jgi:hypothetical protein